MPLPYKPGSNGPEIAAWQKWFRQEHHAYGPSIDGYYGNHEVTAVNEMRRRLSLPPGDFDAVVANRLGYLAPTTPSVQPPENRHLAVVYRGTGGIIGEDYVSRVCQGVSDLVEEQNPNWPATMGGLPIGTAGGISDPSMNAGAATGFASGKTMIDAAIAANPRRKVIIGGYSGGALPAAYLRQWMHDKYPDNYLCSFSFGDPTRPPGGCYYPFGGGADPGGQGIGSWHYGDVTDVRHCWLTNHTAPPQMGPDMYARVPMGTTGEIMHDAYDMATNFSFTDITTATEAIVKAIPEIAEAAGIAIPAALQAVAGGIGGIAGFSIPLLISGLFGLIGFGDPDTLTGTAAAAAAARIGLTFLAAGTGPHVRYEFDEVWPGQTYLGLAIQHVRFYASSVVPAA